MDASTPEQFEKFPLLPPPPGVESNFINPESNAPGVYISAGICIPLILIFSTLRLYGKLVVLKGKGWNDVTFILSAIAGLSYISFTIAIVAGGAHGHHQWDVTIADFSIDQLIITSVFAKVYGPCIWFIKLSLFVLFLELFGPLRWMRYSVIVGMVVTALFYFGTMIAYAVMCTPTGRTQMDYLTAMVSARCRQTRPLVAAVGAVNLASDLYLILLPLLAVWSLHLPLSKKLGILTIFLTGFIACIASILGLVCRVEMTKSTDHLWVVIPIIIANNVELTAGIMVCCMPTTAAVFRHWKPPISSFFSSCWRTLRSGWTTEKSASGHSWITSQSDMQPITNQSREMRTTWKDASVSDQTLASQTDTLAPKMPAYDHSIYRTTQINVEYELPARSTNSKYELPAR